MRATACLLACVLGACGALVCPDGGICEEGNTCCLTPGGGYGCCPLPNAECCSDHLHCCHAGTLCDMVHGTCVNKTHTLAWVRRVGAKQTMLPRAVVCPDQESECPDDTTCCQMPDGTWGCCPMPNAVCCEDKRHCCPQGTTCDLRHSRCVSAPDGSVPLLRKFPAVRKGEKGVDTVPCNDSMACASGSTCCKNQDGGWACCPLPEAVCCGDHVHCCPRGTVCDLSEGTCDDPSDLSLSVSMVKKVLAFPHPSRSPNEKCDAQFSCPQDTTCCKLTSGAWGCCPLPQAVCCEDHQHCCPHNTVCNVAAGTCDSVSEADVHFTVPWVTKTPAVAPENERCDETSACPTGTTCCMEKSGTWACCLLPQAVCCEDHEHCCPQGYTCDVARRSCGHPSLPRMPWARKRPALREGQREHKCDGQTSCPRGSTCCYMVKLSKWGCCPLPQAVCCGDGDHCCPRGYICDKVKPVCVKGKLQIPWFEKQPAVSAQGSEDVKCDDATSCAAGTTCCMLRTGKWGCCPLIKAVCCEDHEHCCPHDYTCDLQTGTCLKTSATHTDKVALTLLHTLPALDKDEVVCDATRRCSKSQTCCRTSDGEWACCPFQQAVCCKDRKHCCPEGYTCDPEERCTKKSPLTWWDGSL